MLGLLAAPLHARPRVGVSGEWLRLEGGPNHLLVMTPSGDTRTFSYAECRLGMGAETKSERRPEQERVCKPRGPQHGVGGRDGLHSRDLKQLRGSFPPTSSHRLQREPGLTCSHGDISALWTQGVEMHLHVHLLILLETWLCTVVLADEAWAAWKSRGGTCFLLL